MAANRQAAHFGFLPEDDLSMLRFLLQTETLGGPKTMWKEYIEATKTVKNVQCLNNRFKHTLSPNLHTYDDIDIDSKAKLYKKYKIPVHPSYRQCLINETNVQIDAEGFIVDEEDTSASASASSSGSRVAAKRAGEKIAVPNEKSARMAAQQPTSPIILDAIHEEIKKCVAETAKKVIPEFLASLEGNNRKEVVQIAPRNEEIDARRCLVNLKTLVENLGNSDLKSIEKRIDNAILHHSVVQNKISIESIYTVVDVALKMIGQ